jgi:tetratricopeptide (TPR) repeat protein
MTSTPKAIGRPLAMLCWLVILFLCCWMYWPGLDGPTVFDDGPNLLVLDILDENPSHAIDIVVGNGSGPAGRPISMLSFVLEKLYLDGGTRGQKRLNLFLHLACGTLLALLFYVLLSYRRYRGAGQLSLLLATYWLMSPLFVSTVLYSIQRMAQLSTLFMFCSLLAYSVWRIRWLRGHSGWAIVPLLTALILLAVFSKENGVVVLPILVLLEVFWFQFVSRDGGNHAGFRRVSFALIALGVTVLALGYARAPDWVVGGYIVRPYTLLERVLTEGRILWDYIFQLLIPAVAKMGVYHDDIVVSTSLTSSAATLLSWLAWAMVLVLLVLTWFFKSGRYLAFAMLLFLVGHSVESTVLALELYFEHRNYFPAAGIFLFLGVLLGTLFTALPALKNVVLTVMSFWILSISWQASSQVQIWSADQLMRMTTVNAHPESSRANINMAVLLARYGGLQEAFVYSQRAAQLQNERLGDLDVRNMLLACYANQPLDKEVIEALPIWSAQGRIIAATNAFHYLVRKLDANECPALDKVLIADEFSAILLGPQAPATVTSEVYAGLAALENSLQRYQKAYDYADLSLALDPGSVRGMLMKLHFATALDEKEAVELVRAQLTVLENAGRLTVGERQTLSFYTEK